MDVSSIAHLGRQNVGVSSRIRVALLGHSEATTRLVETAATRSQIVPCPSRDLPELIDHCHRRHIDAVLLHLEGIDVSTAIAATARLRGVSPALPIVVCGVASAGVVSSMLAIARAGATHVALRNYDDVALTLQSAVRGAPVRHHGLKVWHCVGPCVPMRLRRPVRYCLLNPAQGGHVEGIARELGLHRRTLVNRFAAAGWPPPKSVFSWCRVLVAARMLQRMQVTSASVAHALGFPSAAGLRTLLRRVADVSPRELRGSDFECLRVRFENAMNASRSGRDLVRTDTEHSSSV